MIVHMVKIYIIFEIFWNWWQTVLKLIIMFEWVKIDENIFFNNDMKQHNILVLFLGYKELVSQMEAKQSERLVSNKTWESWMNMSYSCHEKE